MDSLAPVIFLDRIKHITTQKARPRPTLYHEQLLQLSLRPSSKYLTLSKFMLCGEVG